ncbi:MAG: hypothetical protein HYY17_07915 [Planctomycetes bacterium]|nr:hypothetical protein [Planctomycetota bacterium]
MRRLVPFLALFAPLAACRGKSEADSGPEFVEKFAKAAREKDMETLWALFSQDTQSLFTESAKAVLDRAKGSPEAAKRIKLDYDFTQEVDQIDPVLFAKTRIKKDRKQDLETWGGARALDVTDDGGGCTVAVELPGKGRCNWVLVREKKYLRLNWVDSKMDGR